MASGVAVAAHHSIPRANHGRRGRPARARGERDLQAADLHLHPEEVRHRPCIRPILPRFVDRPRLGTAAANQFVSPPLCLARFIGVADLASVRFSLPSQLLEPTPNLEYWNYLDAPNTFIAIGTADDPLDRMLEVLRFWFTKDLKYAKGRPCKPYNSCLGEFFRCNWEAEDNAPAISHEALRAAHTAGGNGVKDGAAAGSSASSVSSAKLAVPPGLGASDPRAASTVSVPQTGTNPANPTVRVSYLTEQTSHHPPVSAFFISCPEKGLQARGFDQITAKFTGTSIKVMPGEHNLGIFITVERRDNETYQLTHPAAHLGGILRGVLSVSVGDMAFIPARRPG